MLSRLRTGGKGKDVEFKRRAGGSDPMPGRALRFIGPLLAPARRPPNRLRFLAAVVGKYSKAESRCGFSQSQYGTKDAHWNSSVLPDPPEVWVLAVHDLNHHPKRLRLFLRNGFISRLALFCAPSAHRNLLHQIFVLIGRRDVQEIGRA